LPFISGWKNWRRGETFGLKKNFVAIHSNKICVVVVSFLLGP
jgi:hypothetical protein